ncbi:hypothetical protein VNI00_007751 [Paramarasmius palmivorus]|uniref:Uncharacterized protein n=1 Tax=Paramarasmius palmivorus TaxID=297713 RepID=A0AAW0D3W3_9AGAR
MQKTLTNSQTYIPVGLYIPISALYCNTLLANLNIRQHVRKGLGDVITLSAITPGVSVTAHGGTSDRSDQAQVSDIRFFDQ